MAVVKDYPEHISLQEARGIILKTFRNYSSGNIAELGIEDALGCALSQDVEAARNVPHFAASAVDGYALRASATAGASAATPVKLTNGSYQWVNTGSDLPTWADAVLMVEDSSQAGALLTVFKSLSASANIRPLGEDVMAGQTIAREGDIVSPALISLFLCAGIVSVSVVKKPKALFIPTGDEIISQDKWLLDAHQKSGTAAESNSLFIDASFKKWGYDIDISQIIPDDPDILLEKVIRGVKDYDLVLVGAGSAKGRRDHTLEVFQKAGKVLFRWLRMKPGRPAMAAEIASKPVICLPGFPMSTAVVLWSVVYPLLELISSKRVSSDIRPMVKDAIGCKYVLNTRLLLQHSSQAGMEEWLRMQVADVGGRIYSWPLNSGASVLLALAEADGIAMLPPASLECEKDTDIEVMMTREVDLSRRALFQGSDDPAVQLLTTYIRRRGGDFVSRAVGSMGGLAALSRRECHIAAAHLLDEANGKYNDSFIERFSAGKKWERILLFYRIQGIIVKSGNPKNIRGFDDLCGNGVVFTNRQPGAGTRVLFDYYLKKAGRSSSDIVGYEQQCTTHMEAANRVYTGLADAALGIKSAADALSLDFIPLTEEPYELVIPPEYMEHPGIIALLDSLSDPQWRGRVNRMGGYRWPD